MKKLFMILFLVILISGCATVKMPEAQHFIQAKDSKKAQAGESTVIFYRAKKFAGSAVMYHIKDGDNVIGL